MKPILFSTSMVQAIFEGRKTMTRRTVKMPPRTFDHHLISNKFYGESRREYKCPYGNIGDVLWVRETSIINTNSDVRFFVADGYKKSVDMNGNYFSYEKVIPSIFMPKSACRLFLEITDRRIERLLDITGEDCKKEGVKGNILEFKDLWESINGAESWNSNPFVWVITFKQITK